MLRENAHCAEKRFKLRIPLEAELIQTMYIKEMIIVEKLRNFCKTLSESITMTKMDGLLTVIVAALAGCIVGMLISPRRNQTIGCGNGCQSNFYEGDDEWEEEE